MYFFKQPYHTSVLSGQMWSKSCFEVIPEASKTNLGCRRDVQVFIRKLTSMTNASDTWHVVLEEQVAIFPYIIVTKPVKQESG